MAYTPLDITKPVVSPGSRQSQVDQTRANFAALRDPLVANGLLQGFDLTVSGGTSDQPIYLLQKRGPEIVRIDLTWGTTGGSEGNVIRAAYYYSPDGGATWEPMIDINGNYVCTLAYDGSGNLSTTTWGATP